MVIQQLGLLFRFPELNLPKLSASSPAEIEAAAERCREHWGLGLETPIAQIGRVLENAGVIIVRHLVQSKKVDAFSRFGKTTVIFLNQATPSTSRWNFDVAHECGHLVLHQGVRTGSEDTEEAADRFASAFLMPRKAFARDFGLASFSWSHIFDLKRRWHTSAAAVVRRCYDLGLIGAIAYRQSFKYMSAKGWKKGEPYEPSFQEPELLAMALSSLGKKVELSLEQLCKDLRFLPETFTEVTGIPIPKPKSRPSEVIEFRHFA